ncbi:MAG: NRDE family protein, partial [Steroidobacteraceae bacterium]
MCLLVLAWQTHPRYRLVVAANRDEFHERPAAPLAKWPAPDDILAGRDLRANGTWLGLDRRRHFGVITNFRELQRPHPDAPSRGGLIPDYLHGVAGAEAFFTRLEPQGRRYSGFNLLLTDGDSLWYASNRAERFARPLPPGVYGLSNGFLDTPWPKLRRVRRRFDAWLSDPANASASGLFALLDDRDMTSADEELPQTGIAPEWERV